MKIALTELKELVGSALIKQGYVESEATIIGDVLLYAQLRGNNQGIVKLIGSGIPKSPEAASPEVIKETPVSAFIDAKQTHAMLAVNVGVDLAIHKAKTSGLAMMGLKGINTSSGALGYYARKIAEAGLIGIVGSGSMETVVAFGSNEAVLGTNPLAIAVPAETQPLVYDITTSAMAYFGVVEAATAGRSLPLGIAYDKAGNATTDPAAVLADGALESFDGSHKGSGLSIMIQVLAGPLMGAYFTGFGDVEKNWGGHFILAFDPELFAGLEATKSGVTKMTEKIKSTRKTFGTKEIFVPGERGDRRTEAVRVSGEIEVEDNLLAELRKVA
jgi:L-2-hydroxycarboxylate dehydrogenase (NAD+)